jgi:very-short-patch-repair endonuclease
MNFEKFKAIRKEYAARMPEWMEVYEATGDMRQDVYFMDWEFTPIELEVWGDIRCLGLPFFPQLPALNYFLDFGNPFLKIGIECDGKAWHDKEKDRIRDDRLETAGWTIFRIEGHECRRFIVPDDEFQEEPDYEAWRKHYMTTSEGVLRAIKQHYFDDAVTHFPYLVDLTLFNHRSTEYREIEKRRVIDDAGPVRISDMLIDYTARIMRRMERAA